MLFRKHFVLYILFFSIFSAQALFCAEYNEIIGRVHPKEGSLSPAFSAANSSALSWLNLMDNHQYGPSWIDASKFMREVVTKDQWIAAMNGTHRPLGQARTREIADLRQVSTLPQGTEGNFIIITYRTEFSAKQKSTVLEIVVLMQQGRLPAWELQGWRVVHYQIGFPLD